MTREQEDEFSRKAAREIMRGAIVWWNRNRGGMPDEATIDRLVTEIRAEVPVALKEALTDAAAAVGCGMHDIARQTFAASLIAGGVRAAKRVAGVA